jgi:hypothetical protein
MTDKELELRQINLNLLDENARLRKELEAKRFNIPHDGCNYLGKDGEICNKCGQMVDAKMIPMLVTQLRFEFDDELKKRWEGNAIASKESAEEAYAMRTQLMKAYTHEGTQMLLTALLRISMKAHEPKPGHYCEARSGLDSSIEIADNAVKSYRASKPEAI